MIRSMTAYARVESERREGTLIWELRSVNHRFVDVALKMPEALRFLEIEARNRIGVRLRRGRIECTLTWKSIGKSAESIRLNSGLISALLSAAANVEDLSERPMVAVTPFDVLRWPGVLEEAEVDREATGTEAIQLLDVLLDQAVATREAEGLNLAAVMKERLDRIEQYTAQAKRRAPEIRMAQRQKLEAKLAEVSANPNPDRLEQELVYWAQRLDVEEELDRLATHAGEFRKALEQAEATGRRMDFLLQEMNREANTLGSKSSDAETTAAAVEIKVLIEQLREQVQNVE
jgi:uncharacterized protein (TIGR00255 family)